MSVKQPDSSTSKQSLPRRGKRSAEQTAKNRELIMKAARTCFARMGYSGTTNKLVAEKAGLTANSIYNHFSNKSDLYVAVCLEAENEIAQFHREAITAAVGSRDALCKIIDASIELHYQDSELGALLSQITAEIMRHPEIALPIVENIKNSLSEILLKIIEDGQKNGEITNSIDAVDIVNMYISASMGMVQSSLLLGENYLVNSLKVLKALIQNNIFQ